MYNPYPYPNRALTNSLYRALRDGNVNRQTFALGLRFVMGAHREDITPACAFCDATEGLVECADKLTRCASCAPVWGCCKMCGKGLGFGFDDTPEWAEGLCDHCACEAGLALIDAALNERV